LYAIPRAHFVDLLEVFDGARSGDHAEVARADFVAVRHPNDGALVRGFAHDFDLLARLRLFHFQRGAEDFAEQRLDCLVAEGTLIRLLQRRQHLRLARRVVVRDPHLRVCLADLADDFRAARQEFQKL
jgi:hypothetical protein